MSAGTLRIFSDIHFGDRASRVLKLAQLRPLLAGIDHAVLNGDTLDTRPGPLPSHTAECCAEVRSFFPAQVPRVTFLTGNHDADFSPLHSLELEAGEVLVIHGDVFFDNIVPWSRDAKMIEQRLGTERQRQPRPRPETLEERLAVFRTVAASIPQRHQSERNRLKYALHYFADTVWPPNRTLKVLQAWRLAPIRAAELTRRHRPAARFVVNGHTHRPGIWPNPSGVTVINTGSYCPPLGGTVVDVGAGTLRVRHVEFQRGEFHLGGTVAEFPLARP